MGNNTPYPLHTSVTLRKYQREQDERLRLLATAELVLETERDAQARTAPGHDPYNHRVPGR